MQRMTKTPNINPTLDEELNQPQDYWRLLQLFNLYRCFLASTFLILRAFEVSLLGRYSLTLYFYTSVTYLVISLIAASAAFLKAPSYNTQVVLQMFFDILVITLIMHASGGMASGLSVLLIPVIAASSILTPGKISFLYTAMASIAILSEQLFVRLNQTFEYLGFTAAGLSGLTLFATAITINILSRRLGKTEEISQQQTIALAKLKQLSLFIIQKIHTGVIVVDETNQITMINHAATNLFPNNKMFTNIPIQTISQPLADALSLWRDSQSIPTSNPIKLHPGGVDVIPEFLSLEKSHQMSVLVFLEDVSQHAKQVQEMKLVSVGRLTSNIAHEIRNPLGAISHASQLLSESTHLNQEDQHLLGIIDDNAKRTNVIIENILTLSKMKSAQAVEFNLKHWLNKFTQQFVLLDGTYPNFKTSIKPKNLKVFFDQSQLQQVLTNLCENGARYSLKKTGKPSIFLRAFEENGVCFLDIIDQGSGVNETNLNYLFEPFFTTEGKGTGLGLYIAKELCKANGAKLDYLYTEADGSQFRITFPVANQSEKKR